MKSSTKIIVYFTIISILGLIPFFYVFLKYMSQYERASMNLIQSYRYDNFVMNTNMEKIGNNDVYYEYIDDEIEIKEIEESISKNIFGLNEESEKIYNYLYKEYIKAKDDSKKLLVVIKKGCMDDYLEYKKISKKLDLILRKNRYQGEYMCFYTIIVDEEYQISYKEG